MDGVDLSSLFSGSIYLFLMVFVRVGTAFLIMPGIGSSFTPANIRLMLALGIALVMTPILSQHLPPMPVTTGMLLIAIVGEAVVGLFIGTVGRILMSALDTAGMVISMQSGMANAQLFNPVMAAQGSLIGAVLSTLGVVLLFATNLHHLLIYAVHDSYMMFPALQMPESGSMAEVVARAVSMSFKVGIQMSAPFLIVALVLYILMGVLARLMPQVQVFMLAIPLQIMLSLMSLALVLSVMMMFWLRRFDEGMSGFLSLGGG